MKETDINNQIAELNNKVDVLLEYVNQQRLNTQSVQDLINDLSIIGKDVYDSTVDELDKRQVEIKPEELTGLGISFLRNINNFNILMNSLESMMDLSKDLSPIINESIIDFTKLMADFEAKGYFEFFKSMALMADDFIQHFNAEDMNQLREKLPAIIHLIKQLSDDKTLAIAQKAMDAMQKTDIEDPPELGVWKLMMSMNDPGMKKSMGLMVSLAKNMYS